MFTNPGRVPEDASELTGTLLAATADLGDDMLGARRPSPMLLALLWLLALLDGALLGSRFPLLFDQSPGWAVLVGGVFAMVAVGLVAITVAPIRRRLIRPPS